MIFYDYIVDINWCIVGLTKLLCLCAFVIVSDPNNVIELFTLKVGLKLAHLRLLCGCSINDDPALLLMIHKIVQFVFYIVFYQYQSI